MYSVKSASDFRYEARCALSGNWWLGIGATTVACILGLSTIMSTVGSIDSNIDAESVNDPVVALFVVMIFMISLIYSVVTFVLSGPVTLGYIKLTMNTYDGEKPKFGDLFSQFSRYGEGFCVYGLRLLYTFLWVLAAFVVASIVGVPLTIVTDYSGAIIYCLLLIAAIVFAYTKIYGYALAPYIVYEHPGIGASAAIRKSVDMMDGNKWRLFCLGFSFIGWNILAALPTLIAMFISPGAILLSTPVTLAASMVVTTYMQFSYTAFYRQIVAERDGSYFDKDENGASDNSDFLNKLQSAESVVQESKWNY